MKINQISVIAGLAVAGLLCFASAAKAQDDSKAEKKGKRGFPTIEEQMDRLDKELTLTDDQKPKVKKVLEDSNAKRRELFSSGGSREEMRPKMRTIQEEQDKKLKEVLTADQYKKYEAMPRQGGGKKRGEGDKKDETKKDDAK
jgi:Spy/CpxP family protein refolding chaperone